jgi:hypothetical protein
VGTSKQDGLGAVLVGAFVFDCFVGSISKSMVVGISAHNA